TGALVDCCQRIRLTFGRRRPSASDAAQQSRRASITSCCGTVRANVSEDNIHRLRRRSSWPSRHTHGRRALYSIASYTDSQLYGIALLLWAIRNGGAQHVQAPPEQPRES